MALQPFFPPKFRISCKALATFFTFLNFVSGEGFHAYTSEPEEGKRNIVGFWHIGENFQPSAESRDHFVMKQSNEILSSYMFTEGLQTGEYNLKLNYVTTVNLSDETKQFLSNTGIIHEHPPTVLQMEEGKEYYEYPTLAEVWDFCQDPRNIDTDVFYMHSKTLDAVRIYFTEFLLGESCLSCLKDGRKKACGPNYTGNNGWFWKHFSGNFWMTSCSHIATLNFPFYPEILEEDKLVPAAVQSTFHPPYGRIFAEYWMMNDSGERPEHTHIYGPGLMEQSEICTNLYRFADPIE